LNLLTTREVMACTRLSRNAVNKLRARNRFPVPVKFLNSIGYRQDDVERWMQANVSARFHFDDLQQ
jgi:predicted DNA-binding transcriptional regulator AlpA